MTVINKLFKIITTLIQNPETISRILQDDAEKKKVQQHHGLTNGLHTVDILELCPNFQTTVSPYSFLDGTSPVMDIALLNSLAAQLPNCDYLEIGSWRGESIANVAKFAKQCVSVSLSPTEMKAFGLSEKFINLHNFFSKGIQPLLIK